MINYLFPSDFYFQYECPNSSQIIASIDAIDEKKSDLNTHEWGDVCNVKTIYIDDFEWVKHHFSLVLKQFLDEINYRGSIKIDTPWINLYTYNNFQEIHHHSGADFDFASVFFCNDGENFSNFYFQNRMCGLTPPILSEIFKTEDSFFPGISAGDMLIFPAHTLHGVSPHRSNVVRKTLSFNFKLCDYGKC